MIKHEIDAGVFSDMLPEGTKLYKMPELPKNKYKKGRREYEIPDMRLLHPLGLAALERILNEINQDSGAADVQIGLSPAVDDDTEEIIKSIIMGITFNAKCRGHEIGSCICYGVSTEKEDNERLLTFHLNDNFVKAAYAYLDGKERINFIEMMIAVCDFMLDNPFMIQEV